MIAALDAHYDEAALTAKAAAVLFSAWDEAEPHREYTVDCSGIQPYVPGQFFRRELPCLLAVLAEIAEPLDAIVVDGYVTLSDKPGLGFHLWEALHQKVPVVGVAKTVYHAAQAVPVMRGKSRSPLFVTAIGLDVTDAGRNVKGMAGEFRIPEMLKRVDQLARGASA